jgi:hypothetical protein
MLSMSRGNAKDERKRGNEAKIRPLVENFTGISYGYEYGQKIGDLKDTVLWNSELLKGSR